MTARILLDSDICIHCLRRQRNESLTEIVRNIRPDGLAISVITYGEVVDGIMGSREPVANLAAWRGFLAGVDVVDVTTEIAAVWGQLRGELRRRGQSPGDNDLLIASTALYFGMTVFTGNVRHFQRVAGLKVMTPPSILASGS